MLVRLKKPAKITLGHHGLRMAGFRPGVHDPTAVDVRGTLEHMNLRYRPFAPC